MTSARASAPAAARVEVRAARLEDAAGIAEAHVAAWKAAYPGIMPQAVLDRLEVSRATERWQSELAEPSPELTRLVALVDGRIAGFAVAGAPRDEVEDDRGELGAINLHPDFWSQGAGTVLFAAALASLRERGYRRGYLWVAEGNERAIAFYARHGWTLDGETTQDPRYEPPLTELRCSAETLLTAGAAHS